MTIEIRVPRIPESDKDVTIAAWIYHVDEHIEAGEVIVEVETEKLVLEIVAPCSGTLKEIYAEKGTTVVGDEIIGLISCQ